MTVDPKTIRAGLAANLNTIGGGFFTYDAAPISPEPPCAWAWPANPFLEREAMQMGVIKSNWTVTVLVSAADNEAGIDQLDSYLVTSGEKSVWAAIESDRKAPNGALNGAASEVIVAEVRRWDGNYIVAGNGYYAAEIDVTVYGRG